MDACGICGGNGVAVDVRGECCATPLAPSGLCCSGGLDSCGVCGGANACGATVTVAVGSGTASAALAASVVGTGDVTPLSTTLGVPRACVTEARLENVATPGRALDAVDSAAQGDPFGQTEMGATPWSTSMGTSQTALGMRVEGVVPAERRLGVGAKVNVQRCSPWRGSSP